VMAENASNLQIRPLVDDDRPWVDDLMRERWGAEIVVVHGEVYRPAEFLGFVAEYDGERVGLITLHILGDACEVVTLDSLQAGRGVGRALLGAVRAEARKRGCRRLWLVTTNDNIHALGFYQQNGFRLVALRPGAVEESRKVKPSIPLIGDHGIPLRDELELEMPLL
jgi:ribosomal protein S18 acetylase RimI-like enzyme